MTHDEYIKRRDEILYHSIGHALFWSHRVGGTQDDADYTPEVAKQAIDELVEAVLGKPIGRQEAYALTQNDKASKLFVQASQLTVDTQRSIVKGGE